MKDRLHRINNGETVLGGVALGLGRHFNIDPVIIRVVFAILFFTPVPIFIAYVVLWIILPVSSYEMAFDSINDPTNSSTFQTSNFNTMSRESKNGNLVGGIILIVLGGIFAFKTFFSINLFHYIGKMWPLFLVGLGVWLIIKDRNEGDNFDNFNNPNQNQEF